jgi:hypothetical protein
MYHCELNEGKTSPNRSTLKNMCEQVHREVADFLKEKTPMFIVQELFSLFMPNFYPVVPGKLAIFVI